MFSQACVIPSVHGGGKGFAGGSASRGGGSALVGLHPGDGGLHPGEGGLPWGVSIQEWVCLGGSASRGVCLGGLHPVGSAWGSGGYSQRAVHMLLECILVNIYKTDLRTVQHNK